MSDCTRYVRFGNAPVVVGTDQLTCTLSNVESVKLAANEPGTVGATQVVTLLLGALGRDVALRARTRYRHPFAVAEGPLFAHTSARVVLLDAESCVEPNQLGPDHVVPPST